MGFHKLPIERGVYGELSKIQEELNEAFDAQEQNQDLMLLIELSDILGAVEGVALKYGFTLEQLLKFARLRSEVAKEESLLPQCNYKDLILILGSYKCNKNCPFCIAKMEMLPEAELNYDLFAQQLAKFKKQGVHFDNFVLSGNGETSHYTENELAKIVNLVKNAGIFTDFRIQTSGNLFYKDAVFELFSDWLIEVTRVDINFEAERDILVYASDYITTNNFSKARIRLNMVLLKDWLGSLVSDINHYFDTCSNIETIALKILDTNPNKPNKQNDWILKHGLPYTDVPLVKKTLDSAFKYLGYKFNNHLWEHQGKIISMFSNQDYIVDKTKDNLVWYGDKLIY